MYHKIILIGNLGNDPDMRYTSGGQTVTTLSVATNRQYTSSDGNSVKETIWFRVSVWGKQAESCKQYLQKGSKVLVEGRLRPDPETGGPRIWEGQSGPRASYEITSSNVRFLSTKQGDLDSGSSADTPDQIPDEEIPF